MEIKNRIYEIDFLRGLGILLVIFFHTAWNICMEYQLTIITQPWVKFLVFFFAGMLIFISGASSYLGSHTLRRGLIVSGGALLVTLATWIVLPQIYVKFGILHLLGVSMLLICIVKRFRPNRLFLALLALLLIGVGIYAYQTRISNPYLFWLGFATKSFESLDYYPLLPWFGVFLTGYVFSSYVYQDKKSPFTRGWYHRDLFSFAGRHSLFLYLIHQPLVFLLLAFPPLRDFLNRLFG